ncbi:unnamed protein product [Pedinophyceae sp. YPF-701]|nr:unnamed protein product [Pedinophyceae sp. YPF-701]
MSRRERLGSPVREEDHSLFVQFFLQASPYITGHRGKTFVIVIPGEALDDEDTAESILDSVALAASLGVKLVLVLGCFPQIQSLIRTQGVQAKFVNGYRVTDRESLVAAMEAAGQVRLEVEARLSRGPSVAMIRRHEKSSHHRVHYKPALRVASGNYVMAKRRGIVDGVNYEHTGEVRFVCEDLIQQQMDQDCVVILNNIGFTTSGEVLNCNTYEVATHVATSIKADKLVFFTLQDVERIGLPKWLPLLDAQALVQNMAFNRQVERAKNGDCPAPISPDDLQVDMDSWAVQGCPWELSSAVAACRAGVKRAHLIPARLDGGLLLELYTRDGVGTMVSTDFYEGCRPARRDDLDSVADMLAPLERAGIMAPRSREKLADDLQYYFVIERDQKILACSALIPLSEHLAEVAAFCVRPEYRGDGKGDSLLDYLEHVAASRGVQMLCLLTTRTAGWFEQRGFTNVGPAHEAEELPEARRARINAARNSQAYVKMLDER